MATTNSLRPTNSDNSSSDEHGGLIRRSWHALSDVLTPFSPSALARLPKNLKRPARYTRADAIPDIADEDREEDGRMPTVRDYHSINPVEPRLAGAGNVRVPKKIPTPVRVEGKVWFANERTWISYLNISMLIGTLAIALFNASKDDIAKNMAYAYAAISVGIMIYGYVVYQHRITMIRRRDPGHFDQIVGPLLISAVLFIAILVNFIIRVRELQRQKVPIPGLAFLMLTGIAGPQS